MTTPVDRFERMVKSTVKLPKQEGQGVLVTHGPKGSRGGYVITAAHCLQLNRRTVFYLSTNDFPFYDVRTADGDEFRMTRLMVESGLDVAVLWPPDDQEPAFEKDCETYLDCCNRIAPIRIRMKPYPVNLDVLFKREEVDPSVIQNHCIHIYSHRGRWIHGVASTGPGNDSRILFAKMEEEIEGGTSGGPIVDDNGELVSVVSMATGSRGKGSKGGHSPVLSVTLPPWMLRRIRGLDP
jgi:hypothetical protein